MRLPDPIADAIKSLAGPISALEQAAGGREGTRRDNGTDAPRGSTLGWPNPAGG